MCFHSRGSNPFLNENTQDMKNAYSTGDVAYYATMIELSAAMRSANYMLSRPNKTFERLVTMLGDMVLDEAPEEVKRMMSNETYRVTMSDLRAGAGLSVMSVLQCLNKCERAQNKLNVAC